MPYIYYIKSTHDGVDGIYVGQDSGSNVEFKRIRDHISAAYTLSGAIYGSERLIQRNSASNCWFDVFNNENDCYGIGSDTYDLFCAEWRIKGGSNTALDKLNLAEILHLIYYKENGTRNVTNALMGGFERAEKGLELEWVKDEELREDIKKIKSNLIRDEKEWKNIFKKSSDTVTISRYTVADSYKRLIKPSIEREIRSDLKDVAEDRAIDNFSKNLENLLLTPPIDGLINLL